MFCDYASVCGNAESVAIESKRKVSHPINKVLVPIRALRGITVATEVAE